MAIKSATCPNCGASLELDDRLEKGICNHCDSIIIVDDAIQKFRIDVTGKVEHVGFNSAENDIKYANVCLSSGDYNNAFAKFKQALEKDPYNFDGWYGCLKATTENLTKFGVGTNDNNIFSVNSIIKNTLKYASPEQKNKIKYSLKESTSNIRSTLRSNANEMYHNYKKSQQKSIDAHKKTSLTLGIIVFVLFIINFVGAIILDQVYGIQLLFGLFNFIILIVLINNIKKTPSQIKLDKVKPEDYLKGKERVFEKLDEIDEIISMNVNNYLHK